MSELSAADVQATFCATLVDEWVSRGLQHAVIAPGSRSTPMAVALAARDELTLHVFHDERSAAFAALGIGVASGRAAALLCTSGTATTHFHAAVVEAQLAGVPMLVLTADRPPELHGIGAPQTIDQQGLYGAAATFADAGVADAAEAAQWRVRAARWWADAHARPMHVNLPFREPLLGSVVALAASDVRPPVAVATTNGSLIAQHDDWSLLTDVLTTQRGLIIAGRGVDTPDAVGALAARQRWPILADPRSGCRGLDGSIAGFDSILRHADLADAFRPDVVVHLGEPPASKVLGQWLASSNATHVQVLPRRTVIDPLGIMSATIVANVGEVCAALVATPDVAGNEPPDTLWLDRWVTAEHAVQDAFDRVLADHQPLCEPAVARVLSAQPGPLVVASSMPIRDIEWFGVNARTATVRSNRGANGIDGVIATACGVAAVEGPTNVLIGDVAVCHDSSSLTALARRPSIVRIVIIDNDGGAIFSFLPQASTLDSQRFEQLFGTPHGTDFIALAAAHHLPAVTATTADELRAALRHPFSCVIRVPSTRDANVVVHQQLNETAAAAMDAEIDLGKLPSGPASR